MISPMVDPTQNAQSKYGNSTTSRNTSYNNKSNSITLELSKKSTPPSTSTLPAKGETTDYNTFEYLKRTHADISIYELAKIAG